MATKANRLKAITWIKTVFKMLTEIDKSLSNVEKLAIRDELTALSALYDFGSLEKIQDIDSIFKLSEIDEPKSAVLWALGTWMNGILGKDELDTKKSIELLKSYAKK